MPIYLGRNVTRERYSDVWTVQKLRIVNQINPNPANGLQELQERLIEINV